MRRIILTAVLAIATIGAAGASAQTTDFGYISGTPLREAGASPQQV